MRTVAIILQFPATILLLPRVEHCPVFRQKALHLVDKTACPKFYMPKSRV